MQINRPPKPGVSANYQRPGVWRAAVAPLRVRLPAYLGVLVAVVGALAARGVAFWNALLIGALLGSFAQIGSEVWWRRNHSPSEDHHPSVHLFWKDPDDYR
jgi:hypothetical protein